MPKAVTQTAANVTARAKLLYNYFTIISIPDLKIRASFETSITSDDNECSGDSQQKPTIENYLTGFATSPARRERRTNSLRPVDSHLSRGLLV